MADGIQHDGAAGGDDDDAGANTVAHGSKRVFAVRTDRRGDSVCLLTRMLRVPGVSDRSDQFVELQYLVYDAGRDMRAGVSPIIHVERRQFHSRVQLVMDGRLDGLQQLADWQRHMRAH